MSAVEVDMKIHEGRLPKRLLWVPPPYVLSVDAENVIKLYVQQLMGGGPIVDCDYQLPGKRVWQGDPMNDALTDLIGIVGKEAYEAALEHQQEAIRLQRVRPAVVPGWVTNGHWGG